MSARLVGKAAIVTGAGSGIGRAIAQRFAIDGAQVAVLDVSAEAAQDTAARVVARGGDARAYAVDVSSAAAAAEAVAAAAADFGQLTTLVNNAGVFDRNAALLDTDEALWDRVIGVDLKGVYLMTRAAMPHLQASGNASIVNIASVAGLVAHSGGVAYTAAKHGVIGLTKSIAADYGPEVRCNAVLPGLVRTALTAYAFADDSGTHAVLERSRRLAAGRPAEPDEIANAAVFLASDEASFVYGSQLVVDGGRTIV